ncbi:MAG: hypothetical protein AAF667_14550 [Pseudomonadota bacterium]
MTARMTLLLLFALIVVLGILTIVLSTVGDASVTASTGGVFGALDARGLSDDRELLSELYDVVLTLKGPWAFVHWLGLAVLAAGVAGFVVVLRKVR